MAQLYDDQFLQQLHDVTVDPTIADACAQCGHAAIVPPQPSSPVRRLLGMKPRPAECPAKVHDVSGLGAMPCGCIHPSHGS